MAGLDPAIQTQGGNPGWPGFATLTTAMTVLFEALKMKKHAQPGRVLKKQAV
jgi:hypothetical protein